MEQKKSEFNKVLNAWDVLVIAFGAMIGWGWVVSTGGWIEKGGVLGAAIGFVIGGIMIFFVGMTYAELTAAMPQCGGEHVFSYKAMGSTGSFICTWMIILGYVSVACFEACAFPTIITYLWPGFLKDYLYTVAGFDIYASWLIVAIVVAFLIMMINIIGAKTAAILQTVLTCIIGGAGILLIIASVINGTVDNLDGQMFAGSSAGLNVKAIIGVAALSPFYFIGFDVIPQAAEEINVPAKKIGSILILSVVLAVVFYALVIVAVGLVMGPQAIVDSEQATGLVTADAMAAAFNTKIMAKVIIVGGMCGIVTSWNSFLLGGSRAMYSMAESYMIPKFFAKLHPKHKTPINALILIGSLTMLAPFAGRKMLVWISDAGNFGCCVAYCMVALSFIILRKKEPDMPRPYKVPAYRFFGTMAVIMSGFMVAMYCIPGSGTYRPLTSADDSPAASEYFEALGQRVLDIGVFLDNSPTWVKFSDAQRKRLDRFFEREYYNVRSFGNEDMESTVLRYRLAIFRIGMQLTALRKGESGCSERVWTISDDDFATAFHLGKVCLQHAYVVATSLQSASSEVHFRFPHHLRNLFVSLLDSFKRIDVVKEANVREISESTVDKFLRKLQKNDLIVSEGNGYYRKTERGKQVVEI